MAGGAGFMSVGEGDWDSGDVEDQVVSASEDGCAAAIPFLVRLQDFGYLLHDSQIIVVGGARERFSVQPVFAMVARNSRQDDPWCEAEDVVDGSEDESAGETHLFTPVQVDVEGLPGVMAGALLDKIAEADQIDSVDGSSRFFEFFDSGRQIVEGSADSFDSFRGAAIWLPSLSQLPIGYEDDQRPVGPLKAF
jgi:hypothetical protein